MTKLIDCEVGSVLPSLELPLDRTLIVATAISSQDFEDVHHDPGKAQERGTPDIFMSINTTNGSSTATSPTGPARHHGSSKHHYGLVFRTFPETP